jgi:hypothetical protein
LGPVNVGVTAEYSSVPDVDVICSGMQTGFAALLDAARAEL